MDNYKKLVLIQTSASLAETTTYPIDYIKTKMQIQSKRTSFYQSSKLIFNDKNKFQVYNGLKPALLRHCIYTMLRINIYENLRDTNLTNKFFIGGLSGGLSQLIASPCDLIKIRYITDYQSKKKTTIYKTIRNIYNENGIQGLWKGSMPNTSRAILVNFGELATYDQAKQIIKQTFDMNESTLLHVMSSICSGFISSLCCTPADVIKSRMMQINSPYSGLTNCIYKTVTEECILSLDKGFYPIWVRLAPWQLIFWVSYEKLRFISGIESF